MGKPPPPPSSPQPSTSSASSSQPQANPIQERRLFVRYIGYRRRRDALVKFYTNFFSKFGPVEYFDVVWDHLRNLPKGYGFVTFRNKEDAQRALNSQPGELDVPGSHRPLIVYPATKPSMNRIKSELKELRIERENRIKEKCELLNSPISPIKQPDQIPENEPPRQEEQQVEPEVGDNVEKTSKEPKVESVPDQAQDQPVANENVPPENEPKVYRGTKTFMQCDDTTIMAIFKYLPIREKMRCSMVNTRFYYLMEAVWSATLRLSFKESFCLWGGQTLDSNILFKILRKCPGLKIIDLYQTATTLDDKSCDIIGRCCPLLEKLVIRDTTLNKYSVTTIGKFCPNLRHIDFAKCANVTEKGLWGLFNLRPDLEELVLSHCDLITGRCFYLLNNLTYLDLSNCSPALNTCYSRLAQNCAKKLQVLIAPPMSTDGLAYICRTFRNLVRLEVDQSDDQPVLSGAINLSALTRLEILVFRPEMTDLNDETFHYITRCLPLLQELTIFGTDKITDNSVVALPDHCPNLKLINLEGFKFGDASIRAFTRFTNLESLNVAGSLITDEGAYYLLTQLPQLELLGVNSCLGISLNTLSNAYDLYKQDAINKKLLICYTNCRIRISEFKDKDDIRRYESPDIWGSDEEYLDYPEYPDQDVYALPQEQYEDDFYYQQDDDDYIADGDLDYEEEELT